MGLNELTELWNRLEGLMTCSNTMQKIRLLPNDYGTRTYLSRHTRDQIAHYIHANSPQINSLSPYYPLANYLVLLTNPHHQLNSQYLLLMREEIGETGEKPVEEHAIFTQAAPVAIIKTRVAGAVR